MEIKYFFDSATFTLTYVVYDESTRDAVVIDPVLDFDPASGKVTWASVETLLSFIRQKALHVHYILETHAHADHISGAHELISRELKDARIGIGEHIRSVQETFKQIYNFHDDFKTDGSQFHCLFKDNETVKAGSLEFKVLFTPGHTPACASYLFKDAVFSGDALFMPDYGTGRCDFPSGDARALFRSIRGRLYQLPETTRIFVGHDYQPGGRPLAFQTTVGESKKSNIHLKAETTEEEFVGFRTKRDATLAVPRLLFPSVQVNIAAGQFPAPERNGVSYLKQPVSRG